MPDSPTFSVVIPLEFHRGKAEACVAGWTRDQRYPRELFEVILVVPDGFSARELDGLKRLLGPQDRVLDRHERHDMPLAAEGAKVATRDVLFFTEAHCWPEPDVLAECAKALAAHPEWTGFSCRSTRITTNRLSVVEADMYEADIEFGMTTHPWRKILDQCFVVKREAYLAAGGFPAEFGHFAEWVLAARFFERGFALGYWPAARIRHHYIGQPRVWKEFTQDFVEGEMAFLARHGDDPITRLFEPVGEWERREEWRARGTTLQIALFTLRAALIRILLVAATRLTSGRVLRRVMMAYCGALTRVTRLRFLARLEEETRAVTPSLRSELKRGFSAFNLGVSAATALAAGAAFSFVARTGALPAAAVALGAFLAVASLHAALHAYFGWRLGKGIDAFARGEASDAERLLRILDRRGMDHYDPEGNARAALARCREG